MPDVPSWLDGWLDWLDAALRREVLRVRARYQLSAAELDGLLVTDEQVDGLLTAAAPDEEARRRWDAVERYCAAVAADLHESASPLGAVAQEFGLTDAEARTVVVCLAPELEPRYSTLFAYLQDDVSCRLPSVDLCVRLTGGGPALLDPRSPLFADALVDVVRRPAGTWRGAGLLLCDPVRTYVLGVDRVRSVPAPVPRDRRVLLVDGDDAAVAAELAAAGGRELTDLPAEVLAAGERRALADALVAARLHGAVVHAPEPGCAAAVAAVLSTPAHLVLGAAWRPHVGSVRHERLRAATTTPAVRARAGHALATLAQRVELTYGWDDLVLPAATTARLHELSAAVRHRDRVFTTWGFGRLAGGRTSVRVLFSGASGTGKTMSAAVLARETGLDLFAVDTSAVVSKYIGETEKNLERIFRAAEDSGAILLFDEADALFGKRSEVTDAHDRYANVEASYLLQRIERYDGVLVLASNLAVNMDEAFSRRLHGEIEFPQPDEAGRELLWRKAFPPGAPMAGDVDPAVLAAQFALTGGEIRNVALAAAFVAVHDGRPIGAVHVMRALARQRHRQGKLPTFAEFGEYLHLVRVEGG